MYVVYVVLEAAEDLVASVGGVHAAAFGFTDLDHVLNPLRLHRCQAFLLLENPVDAAYQHHKDKHGRDAYEELDDLGIPWEQRKCDLWNPAAVAGMLHQLQSAFDPNPLHVNVSTGPNTVAVGATIASLYWDIRAYHNGGPQPTSPMETVHETSWLPRIKSTPITERGLDVLQALDDLDDTVTGSVLKAHLRNHYSRTFVAESGEKLTPQALNNRLTATLHALQRYRAVERGGTSRRIKVRLTEDGRRLLRIHRSNGKPRQLSLPRR